MRMQHSRFFKLVKRFIYLYLAIIQGDRRLSNETLAHEPAIIIIHRYVHITVTTIQSLPFRHCIKQSLIFVFKLCYLLLPDVFSKTFFLFASGISLASVFLFRSSIFCFLFSFLRSLASCLHTHMYTQYDCDTTILFYIMHNHIKHLYPTTPFRSTKYYSVNKGAHENIID